jgi:hypothetical protein
MTAIVSEKFAAICAEQYERISIAISSKIKHHLHQSCRQAVLPGDHAEISPLCPLRLCGVVDERADRVCCSEMGRNAAAKKR